MNDLTIGIMGCLVNCSNLGCVALSYSLLRNLEEIAQKENVKFEYVVFDEKPSRPEIDWMANKIGIDGNRISLGTCGALQSYNLKGFVRSHTKMLVPNLKMLSAIKHCDVVIDMTGGDSFSDIYGKERFYKFTAAKKAVEKLGVPLILGPQTYGPFADDKVKQYAKDVIEKAYAVMARDEESSEYLHEFCNKEIVTVTDLAFALPFERPKNKTGSKIKIGINPSGLLGTAKIEQTKLKNTLKANYDEFLRNLVKKLSSEDRYEIHFVSHVGNEAIECFSGYDGIIYHPVFSDPIEAKTFIATMDIFIGSRMHATIGAFSAGVATIPVAYSKKFKGLFGGIGYNNLVDLQTLKTEEAVARTLEYVHDYKRLEEENVEAQKVIKERYSRLMSTFTTSLSKI